MAAYPPTPMGTPSRPLPGAFFNTPAPSRPAFNQSLFQNRSNAAPGPAPGQPVREVPSPQALQPVQRAARTINDVLGREANFPDLDSYVRQGISSEYDQVNPTDAAWAPFQKSRMYPIPDIIFEQCNRAEVSTLMGLFAEINHAWVAIDNSFYMWDYTNPNPQMLGFEEQSHQITSVKLLVPRAGVFVADVTHLIAVATTQEIILLGVASKLDPASSPSNGGVRTVELYATGMKLAVKGMHVTHLEGSSSSGRIFFCGSTDTNVYEFRYQQEERWFAGRTTRITYGNTSYSNLVPMIFSQGSKETIVQMVVDDSRRLLYTLSSDSTIRTFHMDSATTLVPVIEKKRMECLRDISHMFSQSPLVTTSLTFVSISPISAEEGSKLHLMATTSTGCRFFLSATRGYGAYTQGAPPQSMQVTHIKFPPTLVDPNNRSASQQMQQYGNREPTVDTGSKALSFTEKGFRYAPGLFFCFVRKAGPNNTSENSLFVSGPDTGRISKTVREVAAQGSMYFEQSCWLDLGAHMEAIGVITKPFGAVSQPIGFGNELAVQYDEPPQELAIMTNSGVTIIRRRRLVDIFAAAIRSGGDDGLVKEINKFIGLYGRAETTATALAVACGQGSDVTPGDPRIARVSNPETLDAARKCFIEYGGRPQLNENSVSDGPSQAVDNIKPSSRHEGLALYMSRLLRSIWKSSVITQNLAVNTIHSTIASAKLTTIQEDLTKLQTFLEKNKSFIEGLAGPESLQRVTSQQEEVALQGEHQALYSLQRLNSSIIEGISFVQMLFDEHVEQIWSILDDSGKQSLRNLTYEALFASDQGKDLAKVLVKAIVNKNIANGSNVDTVADALRRRCGSFCSADDVINFKAQEQLKKASGAGPTSDMGRKLLNESLKLFGQVAGSLSFENLQSAIEQFANLQFYAGAISLALQVANESDRGNRALSWVNENRPADDARIPLHDFRVRCYNLIYSVIEAMDNATSREPEMIDGRLTITATKRNEAHNVINGSDDELFQFNLYEWYLSQGWEKLLLSVDSKYIIPFLTKAAQASIDRADLLWKYHQARENFFEAANVQLELAKCDFPIALVKRIEYLTRAKANTSALSSQINVTSRQARQILQYEVSELLDVANIQDEILHRINGDPTIDEAIKPGIHRRLDNMILGLSDLYNDFADQAGYYDICLQIYESASHRNESDIKATWGQLVEKTHTDVENDPKQGQLPYEAMVTMVKEMSRRLNNSEATFSPFIIIPMLETYAIEYQAGVGPRSWLPDLFLDVNWTHDAIINVLQALWLQQIPPFDFRQRGVLAEHMLRVIEAWYDDCVRNNLRLFGVDEVQDQVLQLLNEFAQQGNLDPRETEAMHSLMRKISRVIG